MASYAERIGSRAVAGLVVGGLLSGCLSGHVLDAARRREVPVGVTAAALDGDDLVVDVETTTTTDLGRPTGHGATRGRVAMATLGGVRPVDQLAVRFEPVRGPLPGRPLPVIADPAATPRAPSVQMGTTPLGVLHVHGVGDDERLLYLDALTRHHYRPWAWAVMPFAVVLDAAVVPPLLLLAPIVMVIGD
jgi:hypothetical protein